jgi:hypothetical protein
VASEESAVRPDKEAVDALCAGPRVAMLRDRVLDAMRDVRSVSLLLLPAVAS